jgi:hypothetical protein
LTENFPIRHTLVNWNPSYDEQAQDRSYRIGQENDVEVIRLVARGTIEEQMYASKFTKYSSRSKHWEAMLMAKLYHQYSKV